MMVDDINSGKVGPGMQLEELVSAYSMFIATMNSIDGPSRGINNLHCGGGDGKKIGGGKGAKFKGKCNNCGKPGHKSSNCTKQKQNPAGNVGEGKPKSDKKDWCKYCIRGPHKEEDCWAKKAGKPSHPDSKCTPAKDIQAATTGVKTTKDMNQEQLSNLFKELVAGH